MTAKYKSPYRRGADDGIWFGIYLSALFITSVWSMHSAAASMISMAMMAGVIPVVYLTFRRTYLQESRTTTLSSLWMQGIVMFLCGSVLSGSVAAIYMKWVNPGYIHSVVLESIEAYRSLGDPNLEQIADGLQLMVDAGAVPSPISLVFASIWTAVLTGSILSLICGLLVRAIHSTRRIPGRQPRHGNDPRG